ncbi:MAG: ATP-binding cassette domain-containing protein [Eubacterium sp.]|nr:ATP-binding cassette domain-containing protein [Eubacterium sp.]
MRKKMANPPVILQMETLECGAACLAMVLANYGKWVPMEQLRVDCGVSRDGSNALNMIRAARLYGLNAKGYRAQAEELQDFDFPCVVFWENNHFIVVRGIRGKYVYVNDPAGGAIHMSIEEFVNGFSGVVLNFTPADEFVPDGRKPSVIRYALGHMKGMSRAVVFVVLVSVLGYIFDMINPAMTKVFLDGLLSGIHPEWASTFFFLLTVFTILTLIVGWIEAIYKLRINGKMAVMGSIKYMWHVFRLPMSFFSQRMSGDIIDRQSMSEEISKTFVQNVAPLFLDSVMMVIYLVMMIGFHLYLSVLGIVCILIHALMARFISFRRINITRVRLRDEGRLHSYTMTGVHMMETIKSCGAETGYFEKWSGCQAAVYESRSRYVKNDIYLGVIPNLISEIADDLILVAGVWFVLNGEIEVGVILSFQQILQLFMRPAIGAIESGQSVREMTMQIERVSDVLNYPCDPMVEEQMDTIDSFAEENQTEHKKLKGDIEIKNLTFGYATLGEPLIRDFSLHIKPGSRVAIVGESGCGKSTIANLLSGLYRPWEGEILYDGIPIDEIDRRDFTGSVAVVDQEIILFEDTIANNIRLWDETIEDFEVVLAARDAGLHDEIMTREYGYMDRLIESGKNLSGGEKQRLEIARALAGDPSIVILDEATSALDVETEAEIVSRICDRGITCIVIAHRLTTIRDCDEILVLDQGRIRERGTHDELVELNGLYSELVTDELV